MAERGGFERDVQRVDYAHVSVSNWCWYPQAVEHYEITRYGTLKRWAEVLGMPDVVTLLDATLQEEAKTDEALTALADAAANQQAVAAE